MADDPVSLNPRDRERFLRTSRDRFKLADEADQDNRELAKKDDEFRNLEHWDPNIKTQRTNDHRPCLVIDKLSQPIRQVTNAERMQRPAIQINPVSGGANRATAEMQQGLIRQIEAQSYADVAYDWAFDGAVSHGWGYFRVLTEYESESSFDQVIKIAWVENPYSVYFDPTAREWNNSDAKWAHVIEDLTPDEYDVRYGGRKGGSSAKSLNEFSGLGNQTPVWFPKGGVRIAEYFYVDAEETELVELANGQTVTADQLPKRLPKDAIRNRRPVTRRVVKWCLHNAVEVLESREWAGKYIPIIEVEGERLLVNGKRVKRGLIRAAQDPQRMYDYWVSAATETTALAPRAPYIMYEGQDEGHEKEWQLANVMPFSSLKVRPTTRQTGQQLLPLPQRIAIEPPIQAMMIGVKQAELDIHSTTAFYDASDPRRANAEQSGKAVLARQQQGAQTNQNYLDNLARSLRYLGEMLIDLFPKIYDRPGRVVQIIGLDDEVRQVMLNQPFTRGPQGEPQAAGGPPAPPRPPGLAPSEPPGQPAPGPPGMGALPAPPPHPELQYIQQGLVEFYDLNAGKYAVTVTVGRDYATKRQEAVASMLELVAAQPAIAPLVSDVLVENMDWPGSMKLAERLKKMLPPQVQESETGQPTVPQLQQQLAALGQQHQMLTQVVQEQAEQIKSNAAENASKERIAQADRESKERIAAVQAQTQMVIAQEKMQTDRQLSAIKAQLQAVTTQMQIGQEMSQADLAERQQMRTLAAQAAGQQAQREFAGGESALDRDAAVSQQQRDLDFQRQAAQTLGPNGNTPTSGSV